MNHIEEHKYRMEIVQSQFSFGEDFIKMVLHDISVPFSLSPIFYEVIAHFSLEEVSIIYHSYVDELQLKDLAVVFDCSPETARTHLKKAVEKLERIYRSIMWSKLINGDKYKTNVYFDILSVFDVVKSEFSPEVDIIMDRLLSLGFSFMYFNVDHLSDDIQDNIKEHFRGKATKLAFRFDATKPPQFIIETNKQNFMCKDYPSLIIPKYSFGTKTDRKNTWAGYFTFK